MGSILFSLGIILPGGVGAVGAGNVGAWCHPETDTALTWDEEGLWLSEHTRCGWQEPPAGQTDLATTIHCAFIYVKEDGSAQKLDPKSHRFQAGRLGAEKLQVQFNDDEPIVLTRCET